MPARVDRGDWTRLRILLEITRGGPRRPVELAEALGVTAQAVSYQVDGLKEDGLVAADDSRLRATPAGVEWLHDRLLEIKRFVDDAVGDMLPLERCTAVAGEDLAPGDDVGLFMERGRLVARKRPSPSTGKVARPAPAGGVVVVRDLTGIVDLEPGRVVACVLPDPMEGLPAPERLRAAADALPRAPAIVACAGVEATHLARKAGFGDVIEQAAAAVAVDASRSGLDVLVVVAAEYAGPVLDALTTASKAPGGPRVDVVRLAPGALT